MGMRKRFNRTAVCSSGNYRESRRAHLSSLRTNHEAFEGSELHVSLLAVPFSEPSDDTLVMVSVFGKKIQMPYKRVKDAGFNWSWV